MRQVLDRFRLPGVADEVSQQRHQGNPFACGEFRQARIRVDLQLTHAIDHRHPFRANMSDLRCMLLERRVTVRIAVGVKCESYFAVR